MTRHRSGIVKVAWSTERKEEQKKPARQQKKKLHVCGKNRDETIDGP